MDETLDITILYSEEDNTADNQGEKGWIKTLATFLEAFLVQLAGKPVKLELLQESNIDLDFSIRTSILVVAVSAKSLQSPTYRFKIQQIINKIYHSPKNSRLAIFKIVKRPYTTQKFSKEFEKILPHNFFYINPSTGKIDDITGTTGSAYEKIFWMKLVDLAHDLAPHLKDYKQPKTKTGKKTVYLAETSIDLLAERDMVRRELLRNGFVVLPNETLPADAGELQAKIKKDLAKCDISVHLIGKNYGQRLPDSDRSLVDLQNHLASEYSATVLAADITGAKAFKRIIWVSADHRETDKTQEIFIRNLKRDAEALKEAEVLQSSLDEFKNTIVRYLVHGPSNSKKINRHNGSTEIYLKKLYLIYDKSDKEICNPVASYIKENGFEVLEPTFEANLVNNKNVHIQNLLAADVSVIFSSSSDINWLKIKYLDLLKAPGLGKRKAFLAKAIYLAPGVEVKERNFILDDTVVVESNGKLDPEILQPFLSVIETAKNG